MIITTEQFVTNFHALTGLTVGERRKNLFILLNNTRRYEYTNVNFDAIQPKTYLEETFKVEVMLYFQKLNELLGVLKSENPILIEKVFKAKSWFWNEAFENITGQQFVDDILGYISYNTKIHLLNKLAIYLNNPDKGNEFYDAVKSKYGLYLASKLISCCSKDYILLCIEKDNIKLMESSLLVIIKRYPDIIEDIFFSLKSIGVAVSVEYDNVFKHIAHNNIELFLKLRTEYRTSLRLGWRCTQKFIVTNEEKAINNANDYYKCLHPRQMIRSLRNRFDLFYANMFPKSIDDFSRHDFNSLLNVIKQLRQPDFNIILKVFKNLYGQEIWDHPELVSLEFLEMMPSAERDAKLQRQFKPPFLSDDKWMCYRPTKIAILYLKDRLALRSDINSRAELVSLLVETCKINKDKVALAQMCQFVVNRHRNDNVTVRIAFLRSVQTSFDLEQLDESHWTPINELIKIFSLNNEPFYSAGNFLQNYIFYRLKNNLPIKQQLVEYCNMERHDWNLFIKYPEYEKLCLLEFANIIPQVYQGEELIKSQINFISAIILYNKRNVHDRISIFSYFNIEEVIIKAVMKNNLPYKATDIILYSARLKDDVNKCKEFLKQFLTYCDSCDLDILIYLIHKNPSLIITDIEKVTNLILNRYTSSNTMQFWNFSRNYQHLEIPQTIIKICLNKIKENCGDSGRAYEKKLAIHALSCLMPSNEYLQIVALHYPRELKADAETQEGQKAYELQEYITDSLKYLIPPSDALESILNFCKGDYLKLIRSSLYSVCCHTNEDKLQPFFAELIGRVVSIRKHALHLTFHVLDKSEIFTVLDKFMKTEKNVSIRKFIFKHCFNFFVKNRDEYSWELVKLNIAAVDVNDQEAFDILMQHNEIPKDYLDQYLTFTWEFLENLPDPENKIEIRKATLLNSIKTEMIPVLGKDFCEPILEKYLFKFTASEKASRFQSSIQSLACKYTIYGEPSYVTSLFNILKDYMNATWFKQDTEASGRKHIQEFVEKFCGEFLENKEALNYSLVFNNFFDLWIEFLKPHEAFSEYLHLKLTSIYVQKLSVNDILLQLDTLCTHYINTYGFAVIGILSGKIENFVNEFIESYEQEEVYAFIESLVENHSSLPCILLALRLLDNNRVSNKTKEKYEKIVQILRTNKDPVIQIYLNALITKSSDFYY